MGKKRKAFVYSNVKNNKKYVDEITKFRNDKINLNDEVVIGMSDNNQKKNKSNKIKKEKQKINKKNVNNNPKKKRKLKKLKIFLFLIIIIVLIIGIIYGLLAFSKSPFFNIAEIKVNILNNNKLTSSEVKSLSQISIGQNIFSINKTEIASNIKTNSYVEAVNISKKLPNTIVLKIEERTPEFQFLKDDQYIYLDYQGYLLEQNSQKMDLPVIVGYKTTDFTLGSKVVPQDLDQLKNIPQIFSEAEKAGLSSEITTIDISDDNDYILNLDNQHKKVHLGDISSLSEKMAYAKEIMDKEHDFEGEIFVNVDLNKGEFPFFREKV